MAEKGPLPLVVGVTGHRDLRAEDLEELKKKVREFFEDLQAKYGATSLVVLSALAEGADRLVAEVAIDLKLRLIVPLPLPQQQYEEDFPGSVDEFRRLKELAERVFDVTDASSNPQTQRPHCYAMVGSYIARHCQILLALWDGRSKDSEQTKEEIGGTAHVVQFKREGVPPPYGPPRNPLDPVETGPVYHLVTPRQSHTNHLSNAFDLLRLDPPSPSRPSTGQTISARKVWDKIFWWMNLFNLDATRLKERLAKVREQSMAWILPADECQDLPKAVLSARAWYGYADSLAQHFQRLTRLTMVGILSLGFLMAVTFQLYSFLPDRPQWLLYTYLGLLILGFGAYLWARWIGRYQDKFLDYRALAEGLRVHLFWRLAGLRRAVSDDYLRKFHSELDWIRQAIRVWTIPASADANPRPPIPRAHALPKVVTHWVQNQEGFFTRRSRTNRYLFRIFKWLGLGLLFLSLALTGIKTFLEADSPILLAMNWTLVISGLLLVYSQIQGYAEHAQQYNRMAGFFMRGRQKLNLLLDAAQQTNDPKQVDELGQEALKLIEDLGQEALIENADWLLLHRARRIQPPGL